VNSLQERSKWQQVRPNFEVGDVVLVQDENLPRNQWPLARVIELYLDTTDKLVRQIKLFVPTAKSDLEHPIHKLVLLVENSQSANPSSPQNETPNPTDSDSIQGLERATVAGPDTFAGATSKKKAEAGVTDVFHMAVTNDASLEIGQEVSVVPQETADTLTRIANTDTPRVQRTPRALKRLESINNKGIKK